VTEPRYLGRSGGYVQYPTIDPLECVTEDDQQHLTQRAHRNEEQRRRSEWSRIRSELLRLVDELRAVLGANAARALAREIDRLDRHV
jgi:hypothetical protein